nr:ribonuclease H-like domain, Gag-pre-integrase domain protein [Tanacetum cinerariifolium]
GLHKGYDRFQSLLSQLETHGAGVSTEDANQKFLSGPQLDHEDLEQVDVFDLEKMDLKLQVSMISTRLKMFYKKIGRKLHFDAKEHVSFEKSASIATIHDTLLESDEHKPMLTINGKGVECTDHAEDETEDYALMAFNSSNSGSDTEDNPHHNLKGKGIIDSGCSKHMTRSKAYLVDYQDFNGGLVAF